ncbi:hypothetical protein [Actinokineospora terrae]|uniref:Uncharacterized protein n=1 Tax=Actinokineospora terrae TaxID=155974 RepID=A0A1H9SGR2_9PSEU|nr:hypothetical protein [Actinokineospora terrae]SER83409.1 hypothetical protein SAMN04487818_105419 [Actinokineospora terrae]
MDPRDRADAILARARARGAYVVTPDSAISPMDASATLQIPRAVVAAIDAEDPDITAVFPAGVFPPNTFPPDDGRGPTEELPAIAQEAATQSVAAPPRPGERPPRPYPVQRPLPVDGLVPTSRPQQHQGRPSLSQRLDGDN